MTQQSLFGGDSPKCSKGWGKRCPAATGPKCTCRCGGHNHGNPKARGGQGADVKQTSRKDLEPGLFYVPDRTIRMDLRDAVIVAERIGQEPRITLRRSGDDRSSVETLPQRYVYHSPTGMEFGYGGSGPADLAINILALVVSPQEAWRLHHDFKWTLMGDAFDRDGGTLRIADVQDWVRDRYQAEIRDPDITAREAEMRKLAETNARMERQHRRQMQHGDVVEP